MRDRIIETLDYARAIVRSSIVLDDCSHDANFAAGSDECGVCEYASECHWLYSNDEFAALEQKPVEILVAALDFAVDYVRAELTHGGHNTARCRCESCTWLRTGQKLLAEARDDAASTGAEQP